jgi:hypothetical protein
VETFQTCVCVCVSVRERERAGSVIDYVLSWVPVIQTSFLFQFLLQMRGYCLKYISFELIYVFSKSTCIIYNLGARGSVVG